MSSFTVEFPKRVNTVVTDVVITSSLPCLQPDSKPIVAKAIWDTGATASVISTRLVKAMGMIESGQADIETANGTYNTSLYAIDVMLPNKMIVKGLTASESDLQACDALIGMDIISLGDMLITNTPSTKFSFRIPSTGEPL